MILINKIELGLLISAFDALPPTGVHPRLPNTSILVVGLTARRWTITEYEIADLAASSLEGRLPNFLSAGQKRTFAIT